MVITTDLISRYPFFADLKPDQVATLANVAEGLTAEPGEFIFHEGDDLCCFYIVVEGAVGVVIEAPNKEEQGQMEDVICSAVGPGGAFAWSALVPPHKATASAKALSSCWLIGFNCQELIEAFKEDCEFGYRMLMKVAQISRDRLRDTRIESTVFTAK
jgi:CRP/FNR family cyclic AMP-dependent transcriptional regulator